MRTTSRIISKETQYILWFGCLFNSIRLFIGAISAAYLIQYGQITVGDIGFLKALQSILIILTSLYFGKIADEYNRKTINIFSFINCFLWLIFMFFGAVHHNLICLYISEIFNAISITISQTTYNAYLLDSYKNDTKSKNFEEILGAFTQYSFIGISLFSIAGSYFFKSLGTYTPIIPTTLIAFLIILSFFFLPNQKLNRKSPNQAKIKKPIYKIILRKIFSQFNLCFSFILISVFYQVVIQYWQIMAIEFESIKSNSVWLGGIFFMLMLSQALAGYGAKKFPALSNKTLFVVIGLLISDLLLILSLKYKILSLLIISLSFFYFFIRIYIVFCGAILHKNLYGQIRARFDASMNTMLRSLTALALIGIGMFSNLYGIQPILYMGGATALVVIILHINYRKNRVIVHGCHPERSEGPPKN